jgi:hypothetical protein
MGTKDRRQTLVVSIVALMGVTLIAWSGRLPEPIHRLASRAIARHAHGAAPVVGSLPVTDPSGHTSSFHGVLTWHNDNARDGLNHQETALTPGSVSSGFGVVFSYPIDGYAYAQPLYAPQVQVRDYGLKNVVYVATENDSVYAFDADGAVSAPLWRASFVDASKGITPIPNSVTGCTDIGPYYGITGTPVIDPVSGTLYVVAATLNARNNSQSLSLHALDITSGAELPGSPKVISASYYGVTFNPAFENSRPGLLLANGELYIGFGAHCDIQPYNGWVMSYDPATLQQIAAWNVTPAGTEGGIWEGGGGPSADSAGNIYIATGNGTFDHNTGGPDFANSVVKMSPSLNLAGYFTPYNQGMLAESDLDIGSGFALLLPDQPGPHPHEALIGGKGNTLYLVDRDNLGGYNPNNDNQIVQEIPDAFPSGLFGGGAYFHGSVYFGATGDLLKQFTLSNGKLNTSPIFGPVSPPYPGATPSISSNGDAGGIVWWILNKVSRVALHAASASNIGDDVYDSGDTLNVNGVKFTTPTIANGRVYVGTQTELLVFGILTR